MRIFGHAALRLGRRVVAFLKPEDTGPSLGVGLCIHVEAYVCLAVWKALSVRE